MKKHYFGIFGGAFLMRFDSRTLYYFSCPLGFISVIYRVNSIGEMKKEA